MLWKVKGQALESRSVADSHRLRMTCRPVHQAACVVDAANCSILTTDSFTSPSLHPSHIDPRSLQPINQPPGSVARELTSPPPTAG